MARSGLFVSQIKVSQTCHKDMVPNEVPRISDFTEKLLLYAKIFPFFQWRWKHMSKRLYRALSSCGSMSWVNARANVVPSVTLKDNGLISSNWRQIISKLGGVTWQLYNSCVLNWVTLPVWHLSLILQTLEARSGTRIPAIKQLPKG